MTQLRLSILLVLAVCALAQNTTLEPNATTDAGETTLPSTMGRNETTVITTVITTTAAPPPTESPVGEWNVTDDDGNTCLLAQMAMTFNIKYVKRDNTSAEVPINLPTDADDSTSVCGNDTSELNLSFFDGWSVSMVFVRDSDKYYMSEFTLTYVYDERFDTPQQAGQSATAKKTGEHFKTSVGKSYQCNAKTSIEVDDNVDIDVTDFRVQPFASETGGQYGDSSKCTTDVVDENLIGIIVGCSVAGLIIILVVSYCVAKRRKAAYTSI
ncbi:lysosome-associated membrane glycoprotein 1-like [Ptychodera flava]|uniref:lysosome-associated membrane glycoprotein 1-like n=1 Tax=Ptychodera flava TaxID=63121 RepID=UPI003969CB4C